MKLKLYVWTHYKDGYFPGLAVALAYNRKQAEKLVIAQARSQDELKKSPSLLKYERDQVQAAQLTVYNLDKAIPFAESVCGGD